jgi:ribonuclease VapC
MIVDSSAMVAVIKREPDWLALSATMDAANCLRMSAASYLETSIVLDSRRDAVASARLDEVIEEVEMIIEPVTAEQAKIARQAYRDYGKGSGHPAGLNFGDCFSYALARDKREPILFKGDDFVHTDLRSAMQQP